MDLAIAILGAAGITGLLMAIEQITRPARAARVIDRLTRLRDTAAEGSAARTQTAERIEVITGELADSPRHRRRAIVTFALAVAALGAAAALLLTSR